MERESSEPDRPDEAPGLPPAPPLAARAPRTMIDAAAESEALALLDRGQRRDALVLLIDRYGVAILAYCVRVLRDEVLAQDVQQVVFLEVHRDLPAFRRESSLWTWICRIAHNRCLDAAARRRREQQRTISIDDDDEAELPASGDTGPASSTERARWLQALERCLSRLSEPVRATVLMKYQLGHTFDEMSAAVGERAGTLQVRVSRALPILRRCLERAGVTL